MKTIRKINITIILLLISIIALSGLANADCSTMSVCGNSPDSNLGFGVAEICGQCYACGVADGICPEDFYDAANTLQGSCAYCPDPDCGAEINVSVKDNDNNALGGVDIIVPYPGNNINSQIITTNISGEAHFDAYSAKSITIIASKQNYQTQHKTINLTRGESQAVEFTNFQQADCQADCTRGDNICHATCIGNNGCTMNTTGGNEIVNSSDIATACEYKGPGDAILFTHQGNEYYTINCCAGGVIQTTRPTIDINNYQEPGTKGEINNLVSHVQGAYYNNEQIFIVSTIWDYNN